MKIHLGNGRCKTCGVKIPQGELRCDAHKRDYQIWLAARYLTEREERTIYKPRYNGVQGFFEARPLATGNKFKFSRHELRFEE
jgi:hypothetical protein